MALSPQEAEDIVNAAEDIVHEAKAVRRRCNVLIQQGARLRDKLRTHLETEEVTRDHGNSKQD